jgi:hypothetical protein
VASVSLVVASVSLAVASVSLAVASVCASGYGLVWAWAAPGSESASAWPLMAGLVSE